MPTILRKDGFSFRLYFNDHSPAHVHVIKADGQAKISIEEAIPVLLAVDGLTRKEVKKALNLVLEHRDELLERWREIYD